MNSKALKPMSDALSRVFDTSTFICAYPIQDVADAPIRVDTVAASIRWFGPNTGKLILLVDNKLLDELASNMLGVEDAADLAAEQGGDALKEVLNMICGNFLTSYFGETAVYDLAPPTLLNKSEILSLNAETESVHVMFNLDETLGELMMLEDHVDSKEISTHG